ncbi:MAG: hypothetical protein Q9183_002542 [Haloplaca sp. 2 TL-2023]
MAQSSEPSANPLGDFIGAAQSAAGVISDANARETPASSSSSPTSATPAAATSASPTAAPGGGGINKTTLIVAIVCAIVGALLIALLVGLCCWCLARRRRRRRQANAPVDEEVKTWRSNEPKNPGRDYSPHRNSRVASMEQQPMIPPTAKVPPMQETHPAYRNQNAENPFVPAPPSPRRTAPNSRAGLTDGDVPGAAPYVMSGAQRPQKPRSRSSSRVRSTSNPSALPTTNTASRPSTPFGLSGVGQPYEDMHVHVLQTDSPSRELQQSLHNREPLGSPPHEPIHRYDNPPAMPLSNNNNNNHHNNRHSTASASNYTNNPHASTNSTVDTSSTEGSTSADDWRYNKANNFSNIPPWEQRQHRYSNPSAPPPTNMTAPPIPWGEREQRYQSPSHSPRQSRDTPRNSGGGTGYVEGARRNSRSPATSINGQPRRLRFSDLQAGDVGYGGYPRHSQGVGEAL